MKIRFTGVGGAFEPEYGNSAALVTSEGLGLLIDCGGTTYLNLRQRGMAGQVTHALITHMHDDHVGSLGSLALHAYYHERRQLGILCPVGLEPLLRTLLAAQITHEPVDKIVRIATLAAPEWSGVTSLQGVDIRYLDTTGRHLPGIQTYAYILADRDGTIAYSGDIGDPDLVFDRLEPMGLPPAVVFHDITFTAYANRAHAYYRDVQRHLDQWEIRGYHNDPAQKPADCEIVLVSEDPACCPG